MSFWNAFSHVWIGSNISKLCSSFAFLLYFFFLCVIVDRGLSLLCFKSEIIANYILKSLVKFKWAMKFELFGCFLTIYCQSCLLFIYSFLFFFCFPSFTWTARVQMDLPIPLHSALLESTSDKPSKLKQE